MNPISMLLAMAPILFSPDVTYLGRCIQGEMSGNFYLEDRDTVGLWIGHTIVNRTEKPWWPDNVVGVVKDACHGYENVTFPDFWALALALRSLNEEDPTDGALFFLSGHDLKNNGWSKAGSVGKFIGASDYSFHFFRDWVE